MGIDLNALLSCHVEGVDECPPLPIRGRPVVPGEEDHVVERHGPPQPSKPNERVSVDKATNCILREQATGTIRQSTMFPGK